VKKAFARAVLCVAVLALASVTLLAQTVPGVVTINGGKNTVVLHTGSRSATQKHVEPAGKPFFTDLVSGSNPYNCFVGYTVSDGAPINTEYTPASQFTATKSGTTATIRIAASFVTGTNAARVSLDKDCKGMPCGTIDKTHLCVAKISNLPPAGQQCTVIKRFKCVAKLTKGKNYWVYVESPANSWEVFDLANTAVGTTGESMNDAAWTVGSGGSLGAFSVQ